MDKFLPQVAPVVNAQHQQQSQLQTVKAFSVSEENRHYLKVFIQTYHNLPVLWDTSLRDYTNRDKRADAYQQLVPIYKYLKRDATLEDVKKKINTLRTNYRKELKVVEAARKQGNHYQPRCWTFYELDFLRNAEKFLAIQIKNESTSSVSPYNVFNDASHQRHYLDGASYAYRMNGSSTSPPPSISEMFHKSFGTTTQQQRTEQAGNQNTSPLGLPGGMQSNASTNHANYQAPTHQIPYSIVNPNKRLKSISSNLAISNAASQNSSSTTTSPNEMLNMACDYLSSTYPEEESIARTWTYKLKRLPREQRLLAEKFINDILFEAESGTLHRGSMQLNANEPYVGFEETQNDDSNTSIPQSPNEITANNNLSTPTPAQEQSTAANQTLQVKGENDNENRNGNNNSTFNPYNL